MRRKQSPKTGPSAFKLLTRNRVPFLPTLRPLNISPASGQASLWAFLQPSVSCPTSCNPGYLLLRTSMGQLKADSVLPGVWGPIGGSLYPEHTQCTGLLGLRQSCCPASSHPRPQPLYPVLTLGLAGLTGNLLCPEEPTVEPLLVSKPCLSLANLLLSSAQNQRPSMPTLCN